MNNKIDKYIIFAILYLIFFFFLRNSENTSKKKEHSNINLIDNEIIKENFFVFDSNNLEKIQSHMYGFSVSKKGILTDNYYKDLGYYEDPDPEGTYVMIRKSKYEIKLNQDFNGNFGLYIFQDGINDYFAISNSFFLLEEYVSKIKNISLNKDYSNNFVISDLCTPTLYETMIKEITKIPFIISIMKNIQFH